jgi:hypothetical protein
MCAGNGIKASSTGAWAVIAAEIVKTVAAQK